MAAQVAGVEADSAHCIGDALRQLHEATEHEKANLGKMGVTAP
jgi:hypothetical protein